MGNPKVRNHGWGVAKRMIIDARWVKIWRDLWSNKTRSILVTLSIAVGVGTIGMIYNAAHIIRGISMRNSDKATRLMSFCTFLRSRKRLQRLRKESVR